MKLEVFADAAAAAGPRRRSLPRKPAPPSRAGRFVLAVSGGQTPGPMLRALAGEDVPWQGVHIVQVDERVAPAGHPDRNLTLHREPAQVRPVACRPGPCHAGRGAPTWRRPPRFMDKRSQTCRHAARLDLVHLGLGPDGHTASLVPGDPVLDFDPDVAITGVYQGRRRMTVTYPALDPPSAAYCGC